MCKEILRYVFVLIGGCVTTVWFEYHVKEAKCWYIKYAVVTVFVQRPGVITYVRNYIISGVEYRLNYV